MKLEYLNSTIFETIATHLSISELASFSLTSKTVHCLVHPLLFSHYIIGSEEPISLTVRQRNNIKRYLRRLGKDEKRCLLIKKFTAWNNYAWGGATEVELLLKVVQQASCIEEFRFDTILPSLIDLPKSSREEFEFTAMNERWPSVWKALQKSSYLRKLHMMPSARFPTLLQDFHCLRSFDLGNARIEMDVDGHLPKTLYNLHLDEVLLFDDRWFTPQAFSSLDSLTLIRIQAPQLKAIASALDQWQGKHDQVPLSTLSIDVFEFSVNERPTVEEFMGFLSSFARIKSVRKLSILSMPDVFDVFVLSTRTLRYDACPKRAVYAVAWAVSRFPNLENLVFHLGYRDEGNGWESRWKGFWGEGLDYMTDAFASLTKLESLETNIYCPYEILPVELAGCHELRRVRVRGEDLDSSARILLRRLPSIETLKLSLDGQGRKYRRGFEELGVGGKSAKEHRLE